MKCVQLLLVFAFFIFPSFINAAKIKCQSGSTCSFTASQMTYMAVKQDGIPCPTFNCAHNDKTDCEDACVYYKCVAEEQTILEGAGCYSDFDNACRFTRTETKNQIIKNLTKSSFEYYDNTTMIVTCKQDNCARDAFEKFSQNGQAKNAFGSALNDVVFDIFKPKDCIKYEAFPDNRKFDIENRRFVDKVLCSKREWCETGKKFDKMYLGFAVQTQGIKACDACVFYRCTADGGRNIMSGFGCYEDFEKICQNVPSDVKESIKKNIKDSFHYGDNSYVVTTCADGENCAIAKYAKYYDANPFAKITANTAADGTCEVGVVGSFSSPHQINIWLLLGLFFAGILYRMA